MTLNRFLEGDPDLTQEIMNSSAGMRTPADDTALFHAVCG
jgi:hypothetical protein